MTKLPPHPDRPSGSDGRLLDASLHLLNRTATDREDVALGVVDNAEIDMEASGRPVITHLDLSSGVFAPLRRRGTEGSTQRVPWRSVASLDAAVHLDVARDDVSTTERERWLRDRFIRRIPGGTS